jgi:hypothetical protein
MSEEQKQIEVNQQEITNEQPKITTEFINQLASNEVFQKWLQSEKDRHFSKGLETWKENNLSAIVEEEIKKRYPEETEEQRQLREMANEIKQLKQENKIKEIRNQAYRQANEKGLPVELLDFFVSDDLEKTNENLSILERVWNEAVQNQVNQTFKQNGREPHRASEPGPNDLETQYQKAMESGDVSQAIAIKGQMFKE